MEGLSNNSNKPENLETSKIKDGVDFVFEECPELATIGTKEQYSEYLNLIFPETKIQKILWHGGEKGIETFTTEREIKKSLFGIIKNKEVGAYFTDRLETAKSYHELKSVFKGTENAKIYSAVVDARNPYIIDSELDNRTNPLKIRSEFITEKERNNLFKSGYDSVVRDYEYVIFNSDQIHILGSNSDLEKFKQFVSK